MQISLRDANLQWRSVFRRPASCSRFIATVNGNIRAGVSGTGRCEKIDLETWSNFGPEKKRARIPFKRPLGLRHTFQLTRNFSQIDFFTSSRRSNPNRFELKTSLFHLPKTTELSSLKRLPTHSHYIGEFRGPGDSGKPGCVSLNFSSSDVFFLKVELSDSTRTNCSEIRTLTSFRQPPGRTVQQGFRLHGGRQDAHRGSQHSRGTRGRWSDWIV
jgi:hypothetical protein